MSPRSILVVDDDMALRQLVQRTLEGAGHKVACAGNGREASRAMAAAKSPYDLVVTDLLMPERDGLELIDELRHQYPLVRVIAMSGGGRVAREEYLRMAKGLGAHALLNKPFNPEQLLSAAEKVLTK